MTDMLKRLQAEAADRAEYQRLVDELTARYSLYMSPLDAEAQAVMDADMQLRHRR